MTAVRSPFVPRGAHLAAAAALARWAEANPGHASWIMQGAPRLTEREHVARFGKPWKAKR